MEYFYPSFYRQLFYVANDNKDTVSLMKILSFTVVLSGIVFGLIGLFGYYAVDADDEYGTKRYAVYLTHIILFTIVAFCVIMVIAELKPHAIKIRREMRSISNSRKHLKRLLHSVKLPVKDGEDGTFIELRVYSEGRNSSENQIQPFAAPGTSNSMGQPCIELPSEPGPPAYEEALSHALNVALSYKIVVNNGRHMLREMAKKLEEDKKTADFMAKEFIAHHGRALCTIHADRAVSLLKETSV